MSGVLRIWTWKQLPVRYWIFRTRIYHRQGFIFNSRPICWSLRTRDLFIIPFFRDIDFELLRFNTSVILVALPTCEVTRLHVFDNCNYLQGLCHWQWAKESVYLTLTCSRNTVFWNCNDSGSERVQCALCNRIFSLAHKGRGDTEHHVKTVEHRNAIIATASANIRDIFKAKGGNNSDLECAAYRSYIFIPHC
jgi:hypothetical protein